MIQGTDLLDLLGRFAYFLANHGASLAASAVAFVTSLFFH